MEIKSTPNSVESMDDHVIPLATLVPQQTVPQNQNVPRRPNYRLLIVLLLIVCPMLLLPLLGIMLALLLPAVQAAREVARRIQCNNHLEQITLALHVFHDVHNAFPPLYTVDEDGKPLHSWRVLILPYMEQQALFEQIRLDEPWDSPHNEQFHSRIVPVYRCPANRNVQGDKNCCYAAIAGEGFIPAKQKGDRTGLLMSQITKGLADTLALVEVREPFCWMDPSADVLLDDLDNGINTDYSRIGSPHRGGANSITFDGSVRFYSQLSSEAGKIDGDVKFPEFLEKNL